MHNQLTGLLRVDVPVIGGPPAETPEADLCAAVAKTGGLGLIRGGDIGPAKMTQDFQTAVEQPDGK